MLRRFVGVDIVLFAAMRPINRTSPGLFMGVGRFGLEVRYCWNHLFINTVKQSGCDSPGWQASAGKLVLTRRMLLLVCKRPVALDATFTNASGVMSAYANTFDEAHQFFRLSQ